MQFYLSTSAAAALLVALSSLSSTTAAPTGENTIATTEKRANVPSKINIGLNDKRYDSNGKSMWTAWVNGADPCNKHTDLGVYEGTSSPCNLRFALDGYDYQYTMQGCGGDLSLLKNGVENVGTCVWAPGHQKCVAGAGYTGRWQCILN